MGDDDDTATHDQQHARWRNTYREQARHIEDTRRARSRQLRPTVFTIGDQTLQHFPIHLGVRDAADSACIADFVIWTEDGDAVGCEVKLPP